MAGTLGRSGRKPVPTALKALRGNLGKRSLNEREPMPRVEVPLCPDHLVGEARREWRSTSRLLAQMGLLARVDRAVPAMYRQAWGRWLEAEEALKKYGVMVRSPNGFPMQSPYLAVANQAMAQMRSLLTEFGMTPASRTRVHAAELPSQEASVWDELDRMGGAS